MNDLLLLLQSRYPILTVETFDEERLRRHLAAAARELGFTFYTWSIARGLLCVGRQPSEIEARQPLEALAAIRGIAWPSLFLLQDFHPYLETPAVVRALRELAEDGPGRFSTLVLASPAIELPIELRRSAARYRLKWPTDGEIRSTIIDTFRELKRSRPLRFELPSSEMDQMIQALRGLTLAEIRRMIARAALSDGVLHGEDLPTILAARREEIERSGVLELCEVGGQMAELGGFAHLKDWLRRYREGFGERARSLGLPPPRGLLLAGVQGCGKSLAAKAISRAWGLPLARLDPGRLFDKFVGETERNFRTALETAEGQAPIVLWIDEIEKAFDSGSGDADGGLSRRLFGSFLTWLQERRSEVFVVATTNDLERLPPELLRKGRFDEIFWVDLPTEAERREIFTIHLALRKQDPAAFDLDALAAAATERSGAEIEQAVVAALYGLLADRDTTLTTERVLREIAASVPLAVARREEIAALRAHGRERFVPVS